MSQKKQTVHKKTSLVLNVGKGLNSEVFHLGNTWLSLHCDLQETNLLLNNLLQEFPEYIYSHLWHGIYHWATWIFGINITLKAQQIFVDFHDKDIFWIHVVFSSSPKGHSIVFLTQIHDVYHISEAFDYSGNLTTLNRIKGVSKIECSFLLFLYIIHVIQSSDNEVFFFNNRFYYYLCCLQATQYLTQVCRNSNFP